MPFLFSCERSYNMGDTFLNENKDTIMIVVSYHYSNSYTYRILERNKNNIGGKERIAVKDATRKHLDKFTPISATYYMPIWGILALASYILGCIGYMNDSTLDTKKNFLASLAKAIVWPIELTYLTAKAILGMVVDVYCAWRDLPDE